jgi:hypothetical protein
MRDGLSVVSMSLYGGRNDTQSISLVCLFYHVSSCSRVWVTSLIRNIVRLGARRY